MDHRTLTHPAERWLVSSWCFGPDASRVLLTETRPAVFIEVVFVCFDTVKSPVWLCCWNLKLWSWLKHEQRFLSCGTNIRSDWRGTEGWNNRKCVKLFLVFLFCFLLEGSCLTCISLYLAEGTTGSDSENNKTSDSNLLNSYRQNLLEHSPEIFSDNNSRMIWDRKSVSVLACLTPPTANFQVPELVAFPQHGLASSINTMCCSCRSGSA